MEARARVVGLRSLSHDIFMKLVEEKGERLVVSMQNRVLKKATN